MTLSSSSARATLMAPSLPGLVRPCMRHSTRQLEKSERTSSNPGQTKSRPLIARLSRLFLRNPAPYRAFSYFWGDHNVTVHITIKGQSFKATANHPTRLACLRELGKPLALWIDGINAGALTSRICRSAITRCDECVISINLPTRSWSGLAREMIADFFIMLAKTSGLSHSVQDGNQPDM
jgi:hypothetical protein